MFIARMTGRSALRRRAMCSLKWILVLLFPLNINGHGPPDGGRMLRRFLLYTWPSYGGRGFGLSALKWTARRVKPVSHAFQ